LPEKFFERRFERVEVPSTGQIQPDLVAFGAGNHIVIVECKVDFSRDDEKLVISYTRLPECDSSPEVINTCLADPDDDGNHPLRIGNQNYFVIGMI
jgi:hypothetical protein